MRSFLLLALVLVACADVEESSTSQDLRPRCAVSNPDCELPDPPPPPPDHPHPQPPPSDDACNALVTGTVSTQLTGKVSQGQIQTVSWAVTYPTTCTPVGELSFEGRYTLATSGSLVVAPISSQTYRLKFNNRLIAFAKVDIALPPVVEITASTFEQVQLFREAVSTAAEPQGTTRQVLINPNVELDISPYAYEGISLADNVQIRGGYAAPTWSPAHDPGPRIFSTVRSKGLLWIRNPNVVLSGFRLEGPDLTITEGDGRGIVIETGRNVLIDNLEVSGFCEAAIYATGTNENVVDIRVRNSYIHHNQGPDGDGYGVAVVHGSKAWIEHNVFDFNRHAIASTSGDPGTSYRATENLVLKGGGQHVVNDLIQWATHSFDVHGSRTCVSDFDCGNGGERYDIIGNTFQYDRGYDFKLRGSPSDGAYLSDNVFPQSEYSSTAATWPAYGMHLTNNTYNKDTFGTYGVCDFDGDGIDDLFLATGRTWWFSSAGKYPWTFLSAQTDELHQIGLGDFNHDGRCDVLRERNNWWELSSGGKTAFVPLPAGFGGAFDQLRFADFNGDGYTDVFRRLPSGQWLAYFDFTAPDPVSLQSSDIPLADLRFGDFDKDLKTDVLAVSGGVWSWSRSGTAGWASLNTRYNSLVGVTMIADIDGLPGADVISMFDTWPTPTTVVREVWLSSGGRGAWTKVGAIPLTTSQQMNVTTPYNAYSFVGRFDAGPPSVLHLDKGNRTPIKFQPFQPIRPHGLYAL